MTREEMIQAILSELQNDDKLKLALRAVFCNNLPNASDEQLAMFMVILEIPQQ